MSNAVRTYYIIKCSPLDAMCCPALYFIKYYRHDVSNAYSRATVETSRGLQLCSMYMYVVASRLPLVLVDSKE